MNKYLCLLLLGPSIFAVSAPTLSDPPAHSTLDPFFPPLGFYSNAKSATIRQPSVEYGSIPTTSANTSISAVARAIADRVDVIFLGVPCKQLHQDLLLGPVVVQARLAGVVIECEGSPWPIYITVEEGGAPVNKIIPFPDQGGVGTRSYWHRLKGATKDLNIDVAPRILTFDGAGHSVINVTTTVSVTGQAKRRPTWIEIHLLWSSLDGVIVGDWPLIIRR